MLDQDRFVLMTLYSAWRSQTISVVTDEELAGMVSPPPDGPGQLSECVDRLVADGYLARSSTSIYLTSKGIEYGLSVDGRP